MKLLVTGGLGYIGGVVTHQLVDAGHQVEVLDDLSTGHRDVLPDGVALHERSIQDVGQVLTRDAGFDGVLHFAGLIAAGESVHRPDLDWDVNVTGSMRLLAAMRDAGVTRLIFSSTGSMYAPKGMDALTENDPIDPPGPYAWTKYAVDTMIGHHARAFGLRAVSLRYFNAAGAAGRLGERHDPETHLIPLALNAAATGTPMKIFGDDYPTPDGTCVRDYIHISDLATVSKVTGVPLTIEPAPRRSGDVVAVVASSGKAVRRLAWKPAHPGLDQIISDAWDFHQKQHGTSSE